MPSISGDRRRARQALRVAGTVAGVAGGLLPLSGVAFAESVPAGGVPGSGAPAGGGPAASGPAGGGAAVQPPAGLRLAESVGQAVLGAPLTLALTVTAPSDRPSHDLVVTEALPPGTTLLVASASPPGVRATVVGDPGSQTLVLSGFADLAPGQSTAVSVELASTAPLGTSLSLTGQAFASADGTRPVPVGGSGLPTTGHSRYDESSSPAGASATVDAYGVAVSDPGPPVLATPGAPTGRVTSTVVVTAARGLAPSAVTVDAYLPAGTSLAGPPSTPPVPAPGPLPLAQLTPAASQVIAVVDPVHPALPALPVGPPPPPPAPVPSQATVAPAPAAPPSASFTRLRWTVPSVDFDHPATLTFDLEVPASGASILVVASGSVTLSVPPGPVQPGGEVTPGPAAQVATASSDSAVDVVPAVPPPPVVAAPPPAPSGALVPGSLPTPGAPPAPGLPPAQGPTPVSIDPLTATVGGAHPWSGTGTAPGVGPLVSSVVVHSGRPVIRSASSRLGSQGSASGTTTPSPTRDPFVAPWAATSPSPMAGAAPRAATSASPTPGTGATLTGASAPLAYTGAPMEQEALAAALAIIAGAALAAAAVAKHRPLPPLLTRS